MPRRRHESIGEMISTAAFFGVSFTLAIASADSFLMENIFKGVGFAFAGILCFLGGLRYPLARLYDKLKGRRHD
mgnify:CR=1 FL=1|tara:strand:- start:278 stop:499 length:222 start_codon:yes stop_codon:yes gene_type:complete